MEQAEARVCYQRSMIRNFDALPGGDLVRRGLDEAHRGKETAESLLVAIGGPRLRRLGFEIPPVEGPEHRLYDRLAQDEPDSAHSRYNALIRRLVSFERALECENERHAST